VMAINPVDYSFNYDLAEKIVCTPSAMVEMLAGVAIALGADAAGLAVQPDERQQQMAEQLKRAEKPFILLGSQAQMHPDYVLLRQLASSVAAAVGGRYGMVGEGTNSLGARIAGLLPGEGGLSFGGMLEQGLDTLVLLEVEPEFDTANPVAMAGLLEQATVVAMTTHLSPWLEKHADFVLPVAAPPETSGTFVNLQGDVQSFRGVARAVGEARPAWKVLRVLGNLTDLAGFDYQSSEEVRDELLDSFGALKLDNTPGTPGQLKMRLVKASLERIGGVPPYATDRLARRARALQMTPDAWINGLRLHPDTAASLGLEEGVSAVINQGEGNLTLPVMFDHQVPTGCVWLPTAVPGSERLGEGFAAVTVEKA